MFFLKLFRKTRVLCSLFLAYQDCVLSQMARAALLANGISSWSTRCRLMSVRGVRLDGRTDLPWEIFPGRTQRWQVLCFLFGGYG